jgi:phytoene dehydrogenase-like protein
LGQGVIGTDASPHDKGTASVYYHHASGRMDGMPGTWGYVVGGMGRVSFILCDIAREAGAVVAAGVPVARIVPADGVELEDGTRIRAGNVVSNADPRVTLRLLGNDADPGWKQQVESVPIEGVTVKVNLTLHELPNFTSRPGTFEPHHTGQVNTPLTKPEWLSHHRIAKAGELPPRLWCELYLPDRVRPDRRAGGRAHPERVRSVRAVPFSGRELGHASRRGGPRGGGLDCAVLLQPAGGDHRSPGTGATGHRATGGPHRRTHFPRGDPAAYMWDRRLSARTPMANVYLCGACTHPGGSVIAINGRNAAMEVLRDLG